MTKIKIILLAFLCVILFAGCQSHQSNATLKVYLVEAEAKSSDVANRKLLFTDDDIQEYNWNNHEITFTKAYLESKKSQIVGTDEKQIDPVITGGSKFFGTTQWDRFLVTINDKIIYEGRFQQAAISSYMPVGAILTDTDNGIKINCFGDPKVDKDARNDTRLKNLLESKNKLQ